MKTVLYLMLLVSCSSTPIRQDDEASGSQLTTPDVMAEDPVCSICLASVGQDEISLTNCQHAFHFDCARPWIEMHSSCPLCRSFISEIVVQEDRRFDDCATCKEPLADQARVTFHCCHMEHLDCAMQDYTSVSPAFFCSTCDDQLVCVTGATPAKQGRCHECREEFDINRLVVFPCGHKYHCSCLKGPSSRYNCPQCILSVFPIVEPKWWECTLNGLSRPNQRFWRRHQKLYLKMLEEPVNALSAANLARFAELIKSHRELNFEHRHIIISICSFEPSVYLFNSNMIPSEFEGQSREAAIELLAHFSMLESSFHTKMLLIFDLCVHKANELFVTPRTATGYGDYCIRGFHKDIINQQCSTFPGLHPEVATILVTQFARFNYNGGALIVQFIRQFLDSQLFKQLDQRLQPIREMDPDERAAFAMLLRWQLDADRLAADSIDRVDSLPVN